ncbi:MAG: NAD-dependent epimerase/dehydratase family protein [Ilumatobacteraceae bacterium]
MNILVVGGAGFLGSHLVDRLIAEGSTVDVVDDLSSGSLANLADARVAGGSVKIHTLDVLADEFPALVAMRPPDVVYHLAWLAPGRGPAAQAGRAVQGMIAVLEAARLRGAKVVTALPGAALYGDVPMRDLPIKEGHTWNPVGLHGVIAKAVVDLLNLYRAEHTVEFTALAMSTIYGPRQRPDGGVVGSFAHAIRSDVSPMIHGDGRQTRDFLYVDDAVDALVRAGGRGGGLVVNIGTGTSTSIRDLWTAMAGPGAKAPVAAPRRPNDISWFALSPTRARIHLAWAPFTDLRVGLRSLG